jgi:amino acid transporter
VNEEAGSTPARTKWMTVRGAAFLGVGSMVGAGIFALLGEAGAIAGAATWLSFLIAGGITALLGYTAVKLGVRYPSSGGFVAYLEKGFGDGHVLGITSWLAYFAMVIVTAMVAVSFGSYTSSLFLGDDAAAIWPKVFAVAVVLAMVGINVLGAGIVARAQSLIVIAVLAVFGIFIVATLTTVDASLLAPSGYPPLHDIVSSVALTFFAFLGFAVITFSAGDLRNPERELPRAMYLAIAITTTVYVLVSVGVFGTLTVSEVIANGSTAIAVAAKPSLGQAGFTLMAVAAMFATAGCTNASLYGAGALTEMLGKMRQFPAAFGRPTRRGLPGGLVITALAVILMATLFDLTAIASIGTVVALALFVMLCVAGLRLRHETGARVLPMVLAAVSAVVVLAFFLVDTFQNEPRTFVSMIVISVLAVVLDFWWKWVRDRHHGSRPTVPLPH